MPCALSPVRPVLHDIRSVALSEIDSATDVFRISSHTDATKLSQSIGRFGLINPPILLGSGGSYQIISGFARVAAFGLLDRTTISARILPPTVSRKACIQLAIVDNTSLRTLNPVEQARCVNLLSTITENTERLVTVAGEMGLAINRKMVVDLMNVLQMPGCLHKGLVDGSIALPVALAIYQLHDTYDIQAVSELLNELNLSLNRQRELLDWIEALTRLEKKSVAQLVADPNLMAVRNDSNLDRRQKITAVRHYFKKRRYPNIVTAEKKYEDLYRSVKIPPGISLIPPPFFESDTYSLKIDFKSITELKQIRTDLDRLIDCQDFDDLLNH